MYKIVIVDDEPWSLIGLYHIVKWEDFGFKIVGSYSSGKQALIGIKDVQPDVLFTDYRMPEMTGIDLIKEVHTLEFPVEYVVVSAYRDFDIVKEALYYDSCNYILKPLQREEIIDTLHKLSKRLNKRSDEALPIPINLDTTRTSYPKELSVVLKRAIGRPYFSLVLSDLPMNNSFLPSIPDSTTITPLDIKSYGMGAIITSSISNNKEVYKLVNSGNSSIGVSRQYTGLENLHQMVLEADISKRGGFCYADNNLVSDIQLYIGSNLDKRITIRDLASNFYINESYLCEVFKKHTKLTVNTFMTKIKMEYAATMLKKSQHTVKEVAFAIGFNDVSYFGKRFKLYTGKTPGEYPKR